MSLYHEPVLFSLGQSQGTLWEQLGKAFMWVWLIFHAGEISQNLHLLGWLSSWGFHNVPDIFCMTMTQCVLWMVLALTPEMAQDLGEGFSWQAVQPMEIFGEPLMIIPFFSLRNLFPFQFSRVEHLLQSRSSEMLSETLLVVCWCFPHLPTKIPGLPCLVSNNLRIFRRSDISGHQSLSPTNECCTLTYSTIYTS